MCPGCYKGGYDSYCPSCRKKLFDGKRVSHILPFQNPKDDKLNTYSERTKGLSISGVQLKYSLKLEDNKLMLTDKGGQFILKPIPPSIEIKMNDQAPENEHLTMHIARFLGISTAENALIYFEDGTPAYITRRFDIKPEGGKYLQEDFSQLLGKTKVHHGDNFKYDGTYEDMAIAMRKFIPAYLLAAEQLFTLILFNYIFSNGDAHLKNFSLIESETIGGYEFAKAYDLMCTTIHTPLESDTALNLYENDMDDEFYAVEGCYGQHHFRELARKFGLQERRAERIFFKMIRSRNVVVQMINRSFLSEEAKSIYKRNFLRKIDLMGLTKVIIADKLFVKAGAEVPLENKVRFISRRGPVIEGILKDSLGDNKYSFIQTSPLIKEPNTVIDGDMMIDVMRIK